MTTTSAIPLGTLRFIRRLISGETATVMKIASKNGTTIELARLMPAQAITKAAKVIISLIRLILANFFNL